MLTAYPILYHVMFAHDDVSQLCFWMVRLFQIFNQIALLGETFKSISHLKRVLKPAEHTGMTFFCGQFCVSFSLCVSFNFWSFSIFLWKLLKLCVCVCVWVCVYVCMDMRVYVNECVWKHTKQMLHCFRVFCAFFLLLKFLLYHYPIDLNYLLLN